MKKLIFTLTFSAAIVTTVSLFAMNDDSNKSRTAQKYAHLEADEKPRKPHNGHTCSACNDHLKFQNLSNQSQSPLLALSEDILNTHILSQLPSLMDLMRVSKVAKLLYNRVQGSFIWSTWALTYNPIPPAKPRPCDKAYVVDQYSFFKDPNKKYGISFPRFLSWLEQLHISDKVAIDQEAMDDGPVSAYAGLGDSTPLIGYFNENDRVFRLEQDPCPPKAPDRNLLKTAISTLSSPPKGLLFSRDSSNSSYFQACLNLDKDNDITYSITEITEQHKKELFWSQIKDNE